MRLSRPMYLEDKMHAEQSDERELEWVAQPQLRPEVAMPIRRMKISFMSTKEDLSQGTGSGKGN